MKIEMHCVSASTSMCVHVLALYIYPPLTSFSHTWSIVQSFGKSAAQQANKRIQITPNRAVR